MSDNSKTDDPAQDFNPDTFDAAAATKMTVTALEERTRIATEFAQRVWSIIAKVISQNAAQGKNSVDFTFCYSPDDTSNLVAVEACKILSKDLGQKKFFKVSVRCGYSKIFISFGWPDGKSKSTPV